MMLGDLGVDKINVREIAYIISESLSLHMIKERSLGHAAKTIRSLIDKTMRKFKIIYWIKRLLFAHWNLFSISEEQGSKLMFSHIGILAIDYSQNL